MPSRPGETDSHKTFSMAELDANIREAVEGTLESYAMLPPGANPRL